jgi:hypothetical protein
MVTSLTAAAPRAPATHRPDFIISKISFLDERSDCVHVGFVYSLPELYHIMNTKKGIK